MSFFYLRHSIIDERREDLEIVGKKISSIEMDIAQMFDGHTAEAIDEYIKKSKLKELCAERKQIKEDIERLIAGD